MATEPHEHFPQLFLGGFDDRLGSFAESALDALLAYKPDPKGESGLGGSSEGRGEGLKSQSLQAPRELLLVAVPCVASPRCGVNFLKAPALRAVVHESPTPRSMEFGLEFHLRVHFFRVKWNCVDPSHPMPQILVALGPRVDQNRYHAEASFRPRPNVCSDREHQTLAVVNRIHFPHVVGFELQPLWDGDGDDVWMLFAKNNVSWYLYIE